MRLTEHTAGCFELKMGSMRILLDYSAAEVSRGIDDALLRYTPLAAVDAGACPAAYESDLSDGAPKWRVRPFDRHWLVEGESRIELPPQEGLDADSIDLLVVSSPEAMLALPYLTEYSLFHGTILATQAVAELGHLAMLELVALREEAASSGASAPN